MSDPMTYTLTLTIHGPADQATAACDQIETAIKALGEGYDIVGSADDYTLTVADDLREEHDLATVTVHVTEVYGR